MVATNFKKKHLKSETTLEDKLLMISYHFFKCVHSLFNESENLSKLILEVQESFLKTTDFQKYDKDGLRSILTEYIIIDFLETKEEFESIFPNSDISYIVFINKLKEIIETLVNEI
jgi:hypothetical protein